MGLSKDSTGHNAAGAGLVIRKRREDDKIVALAGNPNVGKSTVFNELTGLRQHTGNWPGKTVTNAQGYCQYRENGFVLVDLPGCYSLIAHSADEEAARDFIRSGEPDVVVIVCDATCLERNLNLVLQTIEITPTAVVCVNLMDEARKKKIHVDLKALSQKLGVPVIGTAARSKSGLDALMSAVSHVAASSERPDIIRISYPDYIEKAVSVLEPLVKKQCHDRISARWMSLMMLHRKDGIDEIKETNANAGNETYNSLLAVLDEIKEGFYGQGVTETKIEEDIVSVLVSTAEEICGSVVTFENAAYQNRDLKIDSIITGKCTAFPIMMLAVLGVFWLTITGANYPSQLISNFLFWIEDGLVAFSVWLGAPQLLYEMLILGVYRVLAWVVSVMLPPMALFFPLFTLLEDVGFLPRVAFNLDRYFKKCRACGKQALTMCMGFGCNAAGVVGCRIIDSPRERLIAIITNNFVPCNGRLPPYQLG